MHKAQSGKSKIIKWRVSNKMAYTPYLYNIEKNRAKAAGARKWAAAYWILDLQTVDIDKGSLIIDSNLCR